MECLYNVIVSQYSETFEIPVSKVTESVFLGVDRAQYVFIGLSVLLHILQFIFSHIFSSMLSQKYVTLKKAAQANWNSRVVSTIHALVAFFVCADSLYFSGPVTSIIDYNPLELKLLLCFSVGYFIYDLAIVLLFPSSLFDVPTVVHHIVAISSAYTVFAFSKCSYAVGFFMFTEVTTPFINLRWFLSTCNMKESKLYVINGLIMFVGWFIVRICMQYYMVYGLVLDLLSKYEETEPILKFGLIPILLPAACALNTFWFYKIATGFFSAVLPKKQKRN